MINIDLKLFSTSFSNWKINLPFWVDKVWKAEARNRALGKETTPWKLINQSGWTNQLCWLKCHSILKQQCIPSQGIFRDLFSGHTTIFLKKQQLSNIYKEPKKKPHCCKISMNLLILFSNASIYYTKE